MQLANLSPVATSGLYNDLTSKIDGIYEFEFDDLKETISKNYVLITESDYELNQYFDEFVEEILIIWRTTIRISLLLMTIYT